MSSKRRSGAALGDPSKSANKLITDFWGPPARPKRQKTQHSATEAQESTKAPSLADFNLYSQDENTQEARDRKPHSQKQHKKVDTGLNPSRKNHHQKDHGKGGGTSHYHPVPEKPPAAPKTRHLILAYQKGDLFDAPPNSVLIHACNTIGKWGGGIAATFKKYYPAAFEIYKAHCQSYHPDHLIGTALLIAPQSDRYWVIKDEEEQVDEAEADEADEADVGEVEGGESKADKTNGDEGRDDKRRVVEDQVDETNGAKGKAIEDEVDDDLTDGAVKDDKARGKDISTTTTTDHANSFPQADDTPQDNWIQVPKRNRASHNITEQRSDWAPRQLPSHPKPQPPTHTTHEKDIHYVACLFTSRNIGAKRDPPDLILKNTESAMNNFLTKLNDVKFNQKNCPFIPELRMCMINSGLFGVPWERTSKLLEWMELSRDQTWGRGDCKIIVAS